MRSSVMKNDLRMFLCLIALIYAPLFVWPLPVRRSTTNQAEFCRDDYVIVLGSISSGTEEMLSHARSSEVTALEGVGKVTRTELFRFEAYDITNVQWVIRTWNGGHLAIDGDGYLMVKTECQIKTTFLRYIEDKHLFDCFNGDNCTMMLCATNATTGENFLVSPNKETVPLSLPEDACASYTKLKASLTEESKKRNDLLQYRFKILPAKRNPHLINHGLKVICPNIFDPEGTIASRKACPKGK